MLAHSRGEQTRTWGDTVYPAEYGYDDFGRRTTMKTYRTESGGSGSDWTHERDQPPHQRGGDRSGFGLSATFVDLD